MSRIRRTSIYEKPGKYYKLETSNSLYASQAENNGSSPTLRRHKEREDKIRERRLNSRSESADSPKRKPKKKKKNKKKKKKKSKKTEQRPLRIKTDDLPTICVRKDSNSSDFSPVRDAIVIRDGAFVADTDLNISLSNLGLNTIRPLKRLGDKPLYVVQSSGERSVLKKIDLSKRTTAPSGDMTWFEYCLREPMFMRKLGDHKNIVSMKKFHVEDDTLIIDMEMTPKGDLYSLLSDRVAKTKKNPVYSESKVRFIMRNVLNALDFMHEKGIAHRDIKLENILYFEEPEKILKLCDFEFACNIFTDDVEILSTACGTWYCMPPEIVMAYQIYGKNLTCALANEFQKQRDGEGVTMAWDWRKSDIWACGVLMFSCFHGSYPFYGTDLAGEQSFSLMYDEMFMETVKMDDSLSRACQKVLKAMLTTDSAERPFARDLLQMEWFNSGEVSPNLGVFPSFSGSASSL